MTVCEFLAWDSEFFGHRIACVNDHQLTSDGCRLIFDWCAANQIDCLYFLADSGHPETIRLAETNHFQLMDIRLTLEHRLDESETDTLVRVPTIPPDAVGTPFWASALPNIPLSASVIRPSLPDDVEALIHISRDAYTQSRFYNDPYLSRERSSALYQTWIRRSCLEGYADVVWVAEAGGQPVGYVTCKLDVEQSEGTLSLVGMAEQARGQRIGQALIHHALGWFAGQGMKRVSVVTQGSNLAAQRLYQKCGFLSRSTQLWYHRWFTE